MSRAGRAHLDRLGAALDALGPQLGRLEAWGRRLAEELPAGARLLAAGNGGSAAEAQHLTAELVGRFRGEREPFSAIALHADTSALTATANDYDYALAFARAVRAHGRAGDVLVCLSTSGASPNLLAAARAGRELGLVTWALTGPGSCPLAELSDEHVGVPAHDTATIQEVHLVAVHLVCDALERALGGRTEAAREVVAG